MTLTGFRSQNHPQQTAVRGAADDVDDRRTPLDLWAPLHERHRFTIDAAASEANALLPRYWTIEDNALEQPWARERVWCNPPSSSIEPWVRKAHDEVAERSCPLVVMLLPANRTEQRWWQDLIEHRRDRPPYSLCETRFLPGRLRFDRPGWTTPAKGNRPPFGCVLITWRRSDG